ncbi:hypothetical protein ACFV2N_01325 [Streptomyces sp. NPDC059680]|uniref:hypothetical protein n=1 Tax=Streptomyces TaxID=1883 RepID=UPI001E5DD239|nr:hypothetical protein [Streptomyces barringtoniae]MCC5479399.1 hypothetical protein [Streptomyces barringtoniae]
MDETVFVGDGAHVVGDTEEAEGEEDATEDPQGACGPAVVTGAVLGADHRARCMTRWVTGVAVGRGAGAEVDRR